MINNNKKNGLERMENGPIKWYITICIHAMWSDLIEIGAETQL